MSDLRALRLTELPAWRAVAAELRPITPTDRDALAHLYLASYPEEVGAATAVEARAEIDLTFAGEFGRLRPDASLLATLDGAPVGAVLVVERSIWDAGLEGPFVIDLFVHPDARGRGIGEALVHAAASACRAARDSILSLRVGAGTSAAAHELYARLGFIDPDAPQTAATGSDSSSKTLKR